MSDILSDLKDRKLREQKALERLEEAERTSEEIYGLRKKSDEIQHKIYQYLTEKRPQAGNIKRFVSAPLAPFSVIDPVYKAIEAQNKNPDVSVAIKTFAKTYAKNLRDNLTTFATGKDYMLNQKIGSDILTKQLGFQKSWKTTLGGIGLDMAGDPGAFKGVVPKAMMPVLKKAGTVFADLASKSPQIEKGLEGLHRRFNIFYDLEKTIPAGDVETFKKLFRESAVKGKISSNLQKFVHNLPDHQNIFNDILTTAFSTQKQPGMVGKTLDKSTDLFKRTLSWLPNFQIRNMMGGVIQGVSEGARPVDYIHALLTKYGRGGTKSDFYKILQEQGVTKQTGMYEQGLNRFPGKVANWVESLNRTALILTDLRKSGKGNALLFQNAQSIKGSIVDAVKHSEKVFFQYNDKYLTNFEKTFMRRIDPFYIWDKSQTKYWPGAMADKSVFWNNFAKTSQGMRPDSERNNPYLVPEYRKNNFTFGSWNNIGAPLEDFLQMIKAPVNALSGDFRTLAGKTQILGRSFVEFATDWKFFQNKSLSQDNTAGQYRHAPDVVKKLLDYNKNTNTVDPYRKWLLELIPPTQAFKDLWDPSKPISRSFTSFREQDTSIGGYIRQDAMRQKESNFFDNFKKRIGLSSSGSNVSSSKSSDYSDGVYSHNQAMIDEFESKFGKGTFGKQYIVGGGADQLTYFNQSQRMGELLAGALKMATPDIGVNAQMSASQELGNLDAQAKMFGWDSASYKKIRDAMIAKQNMMRPREIGKDAAYFSPGDMKYRYALGATPLEIAYNKAKEEQISFMSKTADIYSGAIPRSSRSVGKQLEAEIAAARTQFDAQRGGLSEADLQKRINALITKAYYAMQDIEAKAKTANANILENWAEAEVNEFSKIEFQRRAAIEKYLGSEDYKSALNEKDYDKNQNAIDAINAKYSKKRRDLMVKEAKAHLDYIKETTKGEAENTIAALKGIYERGGMGIKEYHDKELQAKSSQYSSVAIESLKTANALLHDDPTTENVRSQLNTLAGKLEQVKDKPEEIVKIIEEAIRLLSTKVNSVNFAQLESTLKSLSTAGDKLSGAMQDSTIGFKKDTDTFNKAISELKEQNDKIKYSIFSQDLRMPLGIKNMALDNAKTKWGASISPYAPAGFNKDSQGLQLQQNAIFESGYQDLLKKNQQFPASDKLLPDRDNDESTSGYLKRVEDELARHEANKALLTEEGNKKLIELQRSYEETMRQSNAAIAEDEKKQVKKRVDIATDMVGMLGDTASLLYENSNKQSREAFIVMKTAAIAEATIKGIEAAMNAYKIGNDISPALGVAYAAMTVAFTAAKIQQINAQQFGKAEGGRITGGSGTKDDVPVLAMGGEYMIKKSSAQKYGYDFLEALNKGLIPESSLPFAIPAFNMPDTSGRDHFASGGMISTLARSDIKIGDISVVMDNKLKGAVMRDELEGAVRAIVRRYM